jgi:hypothetical protein
LFLSLLSLSLSLQSVFKLTNSLRIYKYECNRTFSRYKCEMPDIIKKCGNGNKQVLVFTHFSSRLYSQLAGLMYFKHPYTK